MNDLDAGTANAQVAVNVTKGTATLASTTGLTFVYGSNSAANFTVKGTLAALQNAFAQVQFNPLPNFWGLASLKFTYNDFGATGGTNLSASETTAISVTNPDEILVNIYEPTYSHTGTWTASGVLGYNNTPSEYSSQGGGDPTATWTPNLPAAGMYRVEFYRIVVANADHNPKRITIVHNGQSSVQDIWAYQGSSGFVDMGTFFFDGSGGEYLQLTQASGTGSLRANAVRFTPV